VIYRCKGCGDYCRTVWRKTGLGSVCSPACEATVRNRQRGKRRPPRDEKHSTNPRGGRRDDVVAGAATAVEVGVTAPSRPERVHRDDVMDQREGTRDNAVVFASATVPVATEADDLNQRGGSPAATTGVAPEKDPHGDDRDHELNSQRGEAHDVDHNQRSEEAATDLNHRAGKRPATTSSVTDLTRHKVLVRDRHRCRYCGTTNSLHLHHIDYRSQGGSHDEHNLIVLCNTHHDLVHTDKGVWQPILRAYIWLVYVEGRRLFLLDVNRLVHTGTAATSRR
jgi:5-methylcytosine-specific restriction endonuclease McrA